MNNTKPLIFSSIAKSLKFEAEENKQTDKGAEGSTSDTQLDKELNALKDEKSGNGGDNNESPNPDPSGNLPNNDGEGNSPSAGNESDEFSSQQDDSSLDDGNDQDQQTGSAPRKLTLYAEFNRIHNVLAESIKAVEDKSTDNSNLKGCVAQLQEILTDVKFIISNFSKRSEEDIMLQFQLIKKRTSLVLELLQRQSQMPKSDKERKQE